VGNICPAGHERVKTYLESMRETEKISREGARYRSVREFRSC
jgi:hypothetical protein